MKKKFLIFGLLFLTICTVSIFFHLTQQENMRYRKAHTLFAKRKPTEAIPYYKEVLVLNPSNLKATKELAYSYLWNHEFQKAIPLLEELVHTKPNDLDFRFSLAQTYAWTQQYELAILTMQELLKKSTDTEYKMYLAKVYIWANIPQKAIPLLEEITHQEPTNMQAEMLLGKALHYSGENEKATFVFEKILRQLEGKKE